KYTSVGFAANYGASVFWALLYEALGRGRRRSAGRALRDGAITSAVAYVVDYHVVPRRLTPGFELRVPGRALTAVYGALAVGLARRPVSPRSLSRSLGLVAAVRAVRRRGHLRMPCVPWTRLRSRRPVSLYVPHSVLLSYYLPSL